MPFRARIFQQQRECGQRLKALRTQKEWTQEDLAKRSGVGQAAISMIETGQCRPQLTTLSKLARALSIAKHDLWPGARDQGNGHQLGSTK